MTGQKSPIGNIFELHSFLLSGFELLEKPIRKQLGFDFPQEHPGGVLIRAEWRRKKDIEANIYPRGGTSGPSAEVQDRVTGVRGKVYFLGQPPGFALQDHVLVISGGSIPIPTGGERPGMVFLGGWGPHEQLPGDPPKPAGDCLAFLYPADPQMDTDGT